MLGSCGGRPAEIAKRSSAPGHRCDHGADVAASARGISLFTFAWAGRGAAGGGRIPANADGMGVVATTGDIVTLIRNHEIVDANGAFAPGADAYDPDCGAGCVVLRVDLAAEAADCGPGATRTLVMRRGVTPWGTWISCEEIVIGRDQVRPTRPGVPDARLTKIHGLAFEVSADGNTWARPIP